MSRINYRNGLDAEAVELLNHFEGKRLVGLGYDDVTIGDIFKDDLIGEISLVYLRIDLELTDIIKLTNDIFVGRETDSAKESCRKKFAAAAAAVEVDIKEVIRIELNFHPRTAVRNDAESEKGLTIKVKVGLKADAR